MLYRYLNVVFFAVGGKTSHIAAKMNNTVSCAYVLF